MRYKHLLFLLIPVLLFSCKKTTYTCEPTVPTDPPVTPVPTVLLKEILMPSLPSPYYHFEYDATKKTSFASFASDFTRYDFFYSGERLSEMRNNIFVNKDRLQYSYDNAGRVAAIRYADSTGIVYTRINLTYNGEKLIKLEREKKAGAAFIVDKTMTMLYHADGNLREITDHRAAFNGSPEQTFVDRYEQYDNKLNTDGFGLLHNEFFDHLVFLPQVQLQKNNPGKLTRTGDGTNYRLNYTYTYNNKDAPLTKIGAGLWLSGPNAGQQFASSAFFSYYD